MKYLIDTHILIWHAQGHEKLHSNTIKIINDLANEIFVSVISVWELANKKKSWQIRLPR